VTTEARRRIDAARPQSVEEVRSHNEALIAFPPAVAADEAAIKAFLKTRMYRHARVMAVMRDAQTIVSDLFARYRADPAELPAEWLPTDAAAGETETGQLRRICNFIAGMTDRFALTEHQRLFDSTPDLR
jgi:dGTPase